MKKISSRAIVEILLPALIIGIFLGLIGPFVDRGHNMLKTAITAFFMGVAGTLSVFCFERFFKKRYLKKLPFALILLISTVVDTVLITSAAIVSIYIFGINDGETPLIEMMKRSDFIIGVGLVCGMVIVMQFLMLISTLIGHGVLIRVLLGTYNSPMETERFFMFLDMKSSTAAAEKIGHLRYMTLLNDFLYEVSEAVVNTQGEIYKYVGDEAIIVWNYKKGSRNSNCLECFFKVRESIAKKEKYYKTKYGMIPEFKAGLHFGKVVAGELGDYRKEIAYIGDTVNTAARLESACTQFGQSFIISDSAFKRIDIKDTIRVCSMGLQSLRGKESQVLLYSVEK